MSPRLARSTSPRRGRLLAMVAGVLVAAPAAASSWAPAGPTPPVNGPLAFSDGGAGGRDLYLVQPDGTGRRPLASIPAGREAQPSWSPDARRVAFSTELPDGLWAIATVGTAGGDIRLITNGPGDLEPDWSPDGRWLVASSFAPSVAQVERSTLTLLTPDGAVQRPIVQLYSTSHVVSSPTWAPDSQRIAFVLRSNSQGGELYLTDFLGGDVRRLAAHPGWDDIDPAWSPDGRYLAFSAGPHLPGQSAEDVQHGIWMLDTATGAIGSVYTAPDLDLRRPTWSPDGSQLAMDGRAPGGRVYQLYTAPATGGLLVGPLTTGAEPAWGPPLPAVPTAGPTVASPTWPPTVEFPTTTPPPMPTLPVEPTLPPFPTLPPAEPSPTGPPPTFPWPTATATATATPQPTDTASPTPIRTATPTPPPRHDLFLPWLESPGIPEF